MFDSVKNVNWFGIVVGAITVAGIAAASLSTGGAVPGLLASIPLLAEYKGATLLAAGVVGAFIGDKLTKGGHRIQDAATTLVGR